MSVVMAMIAVGACGQPNSPDDLTTIVTHALHEYRFNNECFSSSTTRTYVSLERSHSGEDLLQLLDTARLQSNSPNVDFVSAQELTDRASGDGKISYLILTVQSDHEGVAISVASKTDYATINPKDPESNIESIAVLFPPRCQKTYRCQKQLGEWQCDQEDGNA